MYKCQMDYKMFSIIPQLNQSFITFPVGYLDNYLVILLQGPTPHTEPEKVVDTRKPVKPDIDTQDLFGGLYISFLHHFYIKFVNVK